MHDVYVWSYLHFCQTDTLCVYVVGEYTAALEICKPCVSCVTGPLVAACRMLQTGKIPARAQYEHLQTILSNSSKGCSRSQICLISDFQPPFFFLVSMVACNSRIIFHLCVVWKKHFI